jgi:16S rRNA processing protein RimM
MPSAAPGSIVVMGEVVGAFGVRGSVKVRPFSQAPDTLLRHPAWWLRSAGEAGWREARPIGGRMHGDALIAELAGIATRDAALALKGCEVGVPRDALPRPPEGEMYQADLVGMSVINRQGVRLGSVAGFADHGGHGLLRVEPLEGKAGPERLIPYVSSIVLRVDATARSIEVDWGEDY